ncbi:flagellar biosynthesis repressor FlbT [Methylobacterium radiodurans]|uniref:Flagellar protein FlbT n=1 Tax=Methylobacterium radiodurans TaxID=2202828 RepID=A0A2U8VQD7_9HYPH|nr:flagellar biosynthesis repressor FlbT [Methylobacterium radiodurans]AWN35873.1 flagellar protein FlbT [Methylobacterium radiodurans]
MGLRITLKPNERLIINGASIRNGNRNSDFLIESHSKFLRESEILHESEADTPSKKLWVTLQVMYLTDHRAEVEDLFYKQATAIMSMMPEAAPFMAQMQSAITEGHFHKAIKVCKQLARVEQELAEGQASVQAA